MVTTKIIRYFETYQRLLYIILLVFLALVLIFATINLIELVIRFLIDETQYVLESQELSQIFGYFLLVLIGIEFLDSILTYLRDNVMHVEVIVMVAIIAVARKVILFDEGAVNIDIFGTAALILALGVAYYLIRRSNREKDFEENYTLKKPD